MAIPGGKYKEEARNHTTVWGSWRKDHQWGYKCCQQVTRNSYCTRTAGVKANAASHKKRRRKKPEANRFEDVEDFIGEYFSFANLLNA
ncbi:hypothetical protein C5167_018845 [Papaver somniferum]|uniref:Pre-mRNA-splicing factor SLU7 n=1 Tax=Papaver somniferum TaxID=3469 RepID=A0A4Y7ISJ0_PAPSO|nr:hypothetical protein C5167_018845 [Papaver somniferum]